MVLCRPAIPAPYWHNEGGTEFACCPSLTQADFELMPPINKINDELIAVRAGTTYGFAGFVEQKSVLCRSPVFREYFRSDKYVAGSKVCIWITREHAIVVQIALDFLRNQDDWIPRDLSHHNISDQLYMKSRLYIFAKGLQLPALQDFAWEWLSENIDDFSVKEVVALAKLAYERPDEADDQLKDLLQRCVEVHLRQLVNDRYWRGLLRNFSPDLAAEMFELVTTLLLSGGATSYPPRLPQAKHPDFTIKNHEQICAVTVRCYWPTIKGHLRVARGERLTNVELLDEKWIRGTNSEEHRGIVMRDAVALTIETVYAEIATAQVVRPIAKTFRASQPKPKPKAVVPSEVAQGTTTMVDVLNSSRDAEIAAAEGKRNKKANWFLGIDDIGSTPDDYFPHHSPANSSDSSLSNHIISTKLRVERVWKVHLKQW